MALKYYITIDLIQIMVHLLEVFDCGMSTEEVSHNDEGGKARYRHDTCFIRNVGLDRLGLMTFINDSIRGRQEHSSLCNREIIQSEGRSEQILVASRGSADGKEMPIGGET
jgi:hypothetical protein